MNQAAAWFIDSEGRLAYVQMALPARSKRSSPRAPDQCVFRRLEPGDSDLRQLDISLTKLFNFGFLKRISP